jgi:hypothetical protein
LEGIFLRGGEFVRTPKGGRAVSAGGLVKRLRSRTMFAAIMCFEALIGFMMLGGALYFGRNAMLAVSIALMVKSIGFLGVAALSGSDLIPRSTPARA